MSRRWVTGERKSRSVRGGGDKESKITRQRQCKYLLNALTKLQKLNLVQSRGSTKLSFSKQINLYHLKIPLHAKKCLTTLLCCY